LGSIPVMNVKIQDGHPLDAAMPAQNKQLKAAASIQTPHPPSFNASAIRQSAAANKVRSSHPGASPHPIMICSCLTDMCCIGSKRIQHPAPPVACLWAVGLTCERSWHKLLQWPHYSTGRSRGCLCGPSCC
jgi:hypothetical protein